MFPDLIRLSKNFFLSFLKFLNTGMLFFIIARLLDPETAGIFALSQRYQAFFLVFALWGLDTILIRDFYSTGRSEQENLFYFTVLRSILGISVFGLLVFFVVLLTDYEWLTKSFIILMSASIFPEGLQNLFNAYFYIKDNFLLPTFVSFSISLVRILSCLIIILCGFPIITLAGIIPVTTFLGLLLSILVIRKKIFLLDVRPPKLPLNELLQPDFLVRLLSQATPLAIIRSLFIFVWQADVFIISFYLPETEIGIYSASFSGIIVFTFLLSGYQEAMFPLLTRVNPKQSNQYWKLFSRAMLLIGFTILPFSIIFSFFAGEIVILLFGPNYEASKYIIVWLLWAVVLNFFDVQNSATLVIIKKQNILIINLIICSLVSIFLNVVLIPNLGLIGAAWTKIITISLYVLLNSSYLYLKIRKTKSFQIIGAFAISGGLMGYTIMNTNQLIWVFKISIGLAVFFSTQLIVNPLRKEIAQGFWFKTEQYFGKHRET